MPERQTVSAVAAVRADHRARYEWARDWLRECGARTVIDAACGCGYGARILAEGGLTVRAIDRAREAVDWGRRHFPHPCIAWQCADLERLHRLPRADAVVSLETLEHLGDAPAVLGLFLRHAPLLVASVPNQDVNPFDARRHRWHRRHYTPAEFDALLAGAGFEVVERRCQRSKDPGTVEQGTNGMFLIYAAQPAHAEQRRQG